MPKSYPLPDHALRITTYAQLQGYATAFAAKKLGLLFLLGRPGTGKSRAVSEAVGDDCCWICGNASPFGIYMSAYEHRNQLLILDDVDGLYRDRTGLRLLKSLCQSDPLKRVAWHTDAATLDRRGVPREFTTTSHVAIIANQRKSLSEDVAALEDRGHVIHFDPRPLEIHKQAASWYWDQEVFDFVAANLHLIEDHSLRTYFRTWELKSAGLDWRAAVLSSFLSGKALEVAKLRADPSFDSEEARARAFVQAGHGCRATYYSHAKRFSQTAKTPQFTLTATSPPKPRESSEGLSELLRRRYGKLGNG